VAEYQTPEFHPAFEEYCEAIWELKEDQVDVIQARVAERLRVSRPAVSEMIKRMQAEGFVTVDGTTINLTEAGQRLAERVVRRHRLAERLLTDILGLSWADAHVEAGKWEHVISEPVEEAINRLLDNPTTCPHGNPIPGSGYTPPDVVPLSEVEVGGQFTVNRTRRSWSSRRACSTSSRTPPSSRATRARSPPSPPTARSPSRSRASTSASGPSRPSASS